MIIGGSHSVQDADDSMLNDREGKYECYSIQKCLKNVHLCTGMYMGHVKEMIDCYVDFLVMVVA